MSKLDYVLNYLIANIYYINKLDKDKKIQV